MWVQCDFKSEYAGNSQHRQFGTAGIGVLGSVIDGRPGQKRRLSDDLLSSTGRVLFPIRGSPILQSRCSVLHSGFQSFFCDIVAGLGTCGQTSRSLFTEGHVTIVGLDAELALTGGALALFVGSRWCTC